MKILVVDDDKVMLALLSKKLKDKGYEVSVTSNGVESLRIISEEKIDLVISDVMMPCISGFTLITMLKSFYFLNIPVILMSSNKQEKMLLNSHGIDESGFFAKPIEYPRLFERIEQYSHSNPQVA
jgi:CheY-like chemotaxis protein